MFKNRTVQIVLGVVLVVALLLGGYFLIASKQQKAVPQEAEDADVVHTISPESLGLTLEAKPDNKAVKFMLANAADIKTIEYQLIYEADSTAAEQAEGGEARVQRGITGEETLNGKSTYESPWLDLGSCSRNICRYDTGVDSVKLTLKIVKKDGKIYETEKSLDL